MSAIPPKEDRGPARSNANTVIRVPTEFGNPATCFMQAQAYLAGSSIGRELDVNERVRIICVTRESVIAPRQ